MERSGRRFVWWILGAALLLLAAFLYAWYMERPDGDLGTLVDSFEYLERAVYGI